MSEANPSSLEFSWYLENNKIRKEKIQSNGFTSKLNWQPRKMEDFGSITCRGTNEIGDGECKIELQLGGKYIYLNTVYNKLFKLFYLYGQTASV